MRIATTCLLCALLALSLRSAAPDQNKASGDAQAFRDARKISDPQAKIDALRRFVAEYPKSSRASAADSLILETLVDKFPNRTSEIDRQAKIALKRAKGEFRMYDYNDVASTLADANVLLPRAERISQKSLNMLHEKTYVANMRKEYAQAKMKPPSDAALHRDFLKAHSSLQATLGRIYVRQGKTAEGEPLLKEALSDDSDNSAAAADLGELAARAGKSDEALAYLTRARLTGKLDHPQKKLLEDLYAKKHGGSMAGLKTIWTGNTQRSFRIRSTRLNIKPRVSRAIERCWRSCLQVQAAIRARAPIWRSMPSSNAIAERNWRYWRSISTFRNRIRWPIRMA